MIGAVSKSMNVCIVLEEGNGSTESPFCGKIIDCALCGPDAMQGRGFCEAWWDLRCGRIRRRAAAKAAAAGKDNWEKRPDADGAGGGSSDEQSSGGEGNGSCQGRPWSASYKGEAASSDAVWHRPQQMLTSPFTKTTPEGRQRVTRG